MASRHATVIGQLLSKSVPVLVSLYLSVTAASAHIDRLAVCLAVPCRIGTDPEIPSGEITMGRDDFTLRVFGSDLELGEEILWTDSRNPNGVVLRETSHSESEKRVVVPRSLIAIAGPALITLRGYNSLPFVVHPPPAILTQSPLPAGRVGTAYSKALDRSGGTPPFQWLTATAPPGLSLSVDGVVRGTPTAPGAFTISVQIRDAALIIAQKSFSLTIVGNAPVAVDDSYTALVDLPLTIGARGVLQNDTDPDGRALTATKLTDPTNAASFTFNTDGSFSYVPRAGFAGQDSFTYRATNGSTTSNPATVRIAVLGGVPSCVLVPKDAELVFGPILRVAGHDLPGFNLTVTVEVSVVDPITRLLVGPASGVPVGFRSENYPQTPDVPGIVSLPPPPSNCGSVACEFAVTSNGSADFHVIREFERTEAGGRARPPKLRTYAEGTVGGRTFSCEGSVTSKVNSDLWCSSVFGRCISMILDHDACDGGLALPQLRQFRDSVLARNQAGRRYIDQYYRFSPELVQIALRSPRLFLRAREAFQRYVPLVKSALDGRPGSLSRQDLDDIGTLMTAFQAQAGPELRLALAGLRDRLNDPGFLAQFGVTIENRRAPVLAAYRGLPLSFEKAGSEVDSGEFVVRGAGYGLRVKPAEAMIRRAGGTGLSLRLEGASRSARAIPQDELAGRTHYLTGNDPSKWRTDIRQFAKVRYQSVYPGVDVIYYGNQSQLEFDFVLAPGARPDRIGLSFPGGKRMAVEPSGDLLLDARENLRLRKPIAYQMVAGVRREVDARYRISDGDRVGFAVGSYDRTKPLVIDPVLSYSTYLGGSQDDFSTAVAVDSTGAYFVGATVSPDFTLRSSLQGALRSGGIAGSDVFVTKLNPAGNAVIYSTYFGGGNDDIGLGIAVDAQGNAYITGVTRSTDLPVVQPFQRNFGGAGQVTGSDAFVAKLNAAGSALIYSTYLGGTGDDGARGIAVDATGNAYVAGATTSTNFPVLSAFQSANRGGPGFASDAFVAKLNSAGSALVYSTYLGGVGDDGATAIALDASGSAYVTGATFAADFPVATPYQRASGGTADVFVSKLSANGSALSYSTYLGGKGEDYGMGIAVDRQGSAYVTGSTGSLTDFPLLNAAQPSFGSGKLPGVDGFVTKLNSTGSALSYSTFIGGAGYDMGFGIAVDSLGNAYVAGETGSADFASPGALQAAAGGRKDGFVAKLLAAGDAFEYRSFHGGSDQDSLMGIALDATGSVFVAGGSMSTDSPATIGVLQPISKGNMEALVAKLVPGTPTPAFASVSAGALQTSTALAPESIASGFGQRLAAGTTIASALPLLTTLGGVSVNITDSGGTPVAAPLFAVTPTQINYVVPPGLRSGLASVTVMEGSRIVASGTARIQTVAPSLFSANASGRGVAAALVLHVPADGARDTQLIYQCGAAPGSCTSIPLGRESEDDEMFLLLFGTGIRGFTTPVTATVGGVSIPVLGAVAQGETPGLDQVNIGPLPRSLTGRGEVDIILTVDGRKTNPVKVNLR